MSDFPPAASMSFPTAGVIGTGSTAAMTHDANYPLYNAGAVWPTANLAMYIPFIVEAAVTAYQIAFEVTTQSGNYDAGIYNELGTRLVSMGSTAVPAAGIATANIADTALQPGLYFMALCVDNTTASITRHTGATALWLQVCGVRQQAVGAVTLPDPATFANPANAFLPGMAVSLKSTI